jgi:uncharacterized protein with HEPN domain
VRNIRLYLWDILRAIDSIESFVVDMDLQTFETDDRTSSAVVRKFEIIGEATKQIPDSIRLSLLDGQFPYVRPLCRKLSRQ